MIKQRNKNESFVFPPPDPAEKQKTEAESVFKLELLRCLSYL